MTSILGISAFYHDSAAALVVDGRIVAAAQEERFSRIKHDASFPRRSIEYCLASAGLDLAQLDYVAFYEKPLAKFDRLLETFLAVAPRGFCAFLAAMPPWLNRKLHVERELDRALRPGYRRRYVFTDHHEAHAASAFFPSPFPEAAILTADGVGEWATATLGVGRGHRIELTHELRFPHSLGMLYSAFTSFCGFRVNSGEYKLMGLAPYGEPKYADLILERLADLKDDGSFRLDMRYFNYCQGLTMTSAAFHELFGGPPRLPEAPPTKREMDLAASIQSVTEEIMLRAVRHLHRQTGLSRLCMAGGVALNCVANGRVAREGPFDEIWIQPAAGDAGGALGAALFVWHQLLGQARVCQAADSQQGSLLGPSFTDQEICRELDTLGADYQSYAGDVELCDRVAALLAEGKVVGWFQGRMEYGPRALGARSILADPRDESMQSRLNCKVKFRESFRPFAPSVLAERAREYFDLPSSMDSPSMSVTAGVTSGGPIPAVTHVDGSARVQTVDARHGRFRTLLERFHARTGCAVLVNTSFNVRGEPIVCTPREAYRTYLATGLDALVLGSCVLLKSEAERLAVDEHYAHSFGGDERSMALLDRNREPDERQVRHFALGWLPAVSLLGAGWCLWRANGWSALMLVFLAALSVAIGIGRPSWMRAVWLLWMRVTFPLAWLIAHTMLVVVYFLIITPIGLMMRVLGRDPLTRRADPGVESYWVRRRSRDVSGYFRQY